MDIECYTMIWFNECLLLDDLQYIIILKDQVKIYEHNSILAFGLQTSNCFMIFVGLKLKMVTYNAI